MAERCMVSFSMRRVEADRLSEVAAEHGLSRSAFLRMAARSLLAELYPDVGYLWLAGLLHEARLEAEAIITRSNGVGDGGAAL